MNRERMMNILVAPRVTEKSTMLGDKHRQFVFRVSSDATKPDIKEAVERMFEVKVASVRVCNVKGKRKLFKNYPGRRPDWKKAYVRLEPGFDINFAGT